MSTKPTKTFICCKQSFDRDGMMEHLKTEHNVHDMTKTTGKAVEFLDGEGGWYLQSYDCECQGVKFVMNVEGKTR